MTQEFFVTPSSILIPEGRQRKAVSDIEEMAESISRIGLLNPIVITMDGKVPVLVAGERRLRAWLAIYPSKPIRTTLLSDLSQLEQLTIELEENVKRRDISWQEKAFAVDKFHTLKLQSLADGEADEWTATDTARALGIVDEEVFRTLRVMSQWEKDLTLRNMPSLSSAAKIVEKRLRRGIDLHTLKIRSVLDDGQGPQASVAALLASIKAPGEATQDEAPSDDDSDDLPPTVADGLPSEPVPSYTPPADRAWDILHGNFLEFAASYTGEPFSFIHCDFPYGEGFHEFAYRGTNLKKTYDDTQENFIALLETFFKHQDRLVAPKAHMLFWYPSAKYDQTKQLLLSRGWNVLATPLVWFRSDNRGIIADSERRPRHVYETAFLLTRGDRRLVQSVADVYPAPTAKNRHPSCKPAPMLQHFFRMFVDDFTTVLDPTCGAGSSIIAARALGARFALGVEVDAEYREIATVDLIKSEHLRAASAANGADDGEDTDAGRSAG